MPKPSAPSSCLPQQCTDALDAIPQVWYCPVDIVEKCPLGKSTYVGVSRVIVVPSPICPSVLFPQHTLLLSSRIEQAWNLPTSIDIAVRPGGSKAYLGEVDDMVVPSPNWPTSFLPQQATLPLFNSAQVVVPDSLPLVAPVPPPPPIAIAANVLLVGRIVIGVGSSLLVVVPSPIWPTVFRPQHIPVPSSKITQEFFHPVDTATAVRPAGRSIG